MAKPSEKNGTEPLSLEGILAEIERQIAQLDSEIQERANRRLDLRLRRDALRREREQKESYG